MDWLEWVGVCVGRLLFELFFFIFDVMLVYLMFECVMVIGNISWF